MSTPHPIPKLPNPPDPSNPSNPPGAGESDPNWPSLERLLWSQLLRLVGRSLGAEVVLREMLHLMSELLGLNRGRIVLVDAHEQWVEEPPDPQAPARICHAYGLTRSEASRGVYAQGEGITGAVLATGQPMIIQDIDAEPRFLFRAVARAMLPAQTVAYLAVPILIDNRAVGVLGCHRIRHRQRALADDLALLQLLATLAGQMLQLAMLVRRRTAALEAQNAVLKGALQSSAMRYGIVGNSAALLKSLHELERVCNAGVTVMLLGESGSGKELFARALHLASTRRERPFNKVNCGAIPETLFESELFGHERGAFTGASASHAGWFERSHGGTLFLDEIGELPLAVQSKLLRTLQDSTLVRLGGTKEIKVDVRVVVATHRNLVNEVAMGRFRRDLYYRLNVVPIRLPALRERREDIKPLALHFLSRANQVHQRHVHFTEDVWMWLDAQPWPGNIRELANLVERVVLLAAHPDVGAADLEHWASHCEEQPVQEPDTLKAQTPLQSFARAEQPVRPIDPTATRLDSGKAAQTGDRSPAPDAGNSSAGLDRPNSSVPVVREYRPVESHSESELRKAMLESGGNQTRAAQRLGLTARQFAYRWKRLKDSGLR
jgi:Nif-specific regulatory protein